MRLASLALTVALGVLSAPLQAQEAARTPLVGVLGNSSDPANSPYVASLLEGLRDLGYVAGRNIRFAFRSSGGRIERLPALAAELVALKPDVIVSPSTPTTLALKESTRTIPVVMVSVSDPVGIGVIDSFAHPGGNVTGLTDNPNEMFPKEVQLLKDLLPQARSIAVLWNPLNQNSAAEFAEVRRVAAEMGLAVHPVPLRGPEDLRQALETPPDHQVDGMLVIVEPLLYLNRRLIFEFADKHRLPAIYTLPELVAEGALVGYGIDNLHLWRRAATYIDRILKGSNPAELPVEQPTRVDLAINLATAAKLGLAIPPSLLARANEVIE